MCIRDSFSEDRQYMPAFVLAVAMARPGVDPAGHARRLMAAMSHIGHTPGYLTGDGLYTDLIPDTFQTEARALGWKLLIHITDKHLHRTPSVSYTHLDVYKRQRLHRPSDTPAVPRVSQSGR